jgi:hypothetical protein
MAAAMKDNNLMKSIRVADLKCSGRTSVFVLAVLSTACVVTVGTLPVKGQITITNTNPSCSTPLYTVVGGEDFVGDYSYENDLSVTVVNSQVPWSPYYPAVTGYGVETWSGSWGPQMVSLYTGINIITASDNYYSSAVITVKEPGIDNHVTTTMTVASSCPVTVSPLRCGTANPYTFCCLNTSCTYQWGEASLPEGVETGTAMVYPDANGCGTVPDASYSYCPSAISSSGVITVYQSWWLTNLSVVPPSIDANGSTVRQFTFTYGPPNSITVSLSGDGNGEGGCYGSP